MRGTQNEDSGMASKPFCYAFPRPSFTVDVALIRLRPARGQARSSSGRLEVLLIQRAQEPCAGAWALPGGFLDMDEELEDAARRELQEETGLEIGSLRALAVYGAVGRDPRGRCISQAYLALDLHAEYEAHAGDDAAAACWKSLLRPPSLAFDHRQILRDAVDELRRLAASTTQLLPLLPARFTLRQLSELQAALGQARTVPSLRKQLVHPGLVREVGRGRHNVRLYSVGRWPKRRR